MRFTEIYGIESLRERLERMLMSGRQPHAMLYTGPEGCAALSLAMAVGRYLLCEAPKQAHACEVCSPCLLSAKGTHPDLHFFYPMPSVERAQAEVLVPAYRNAWLSFAATRPYGGTMAWRDHLQKQKLISVSADKHLQIGRSQIQTLLAATSLSPYMGKRNVICLWAAESLHHVSAHALLKTLESPNEKTFFLLVSHAPQQLLATIRSRMQRLQVPLPSPTALSKHLSALKPALSKTESTTLALRAEGRIDEALLLLEKAEDENDTLLQAWLRACWLSATEKIIQVSDDFVKRSRYEQQRFLHHGLYVFRQVLLSKVSCKLLCSAEGAQKQFIENFSPHISLDLTTSFIDASQQMLAHLGQQANPRMLFLSHTLRMADAFVAYRRSTL